MDEPARPDTEPCGIQRPIDCRPVVAVIAIVIFGLGRVAFLLTLRAFQGFD
jgi:hypothetical protein